MFSKYIKHMMWVFLVGFVIGLPKMCRCETTKAEQAYFFAQQDLSNQLPVFPGAQGFGTATRAGRGGRVIKVTNLHADGPGSFRAAVSATEPRVIVFEVGGVIRIDDLIEVKDPFVTIAGQTAPSPGITVIGGTLSIQTHDVLVQHITVRPGDSEKALPPELYDGIQVCEGLDKKEIYHVVIDHCSESWALDEGMSTWGKRIHDITFRQCIIAENLSHSIHSKGEHSKGLLIGDHDRRIAVIGNLFAHNTDRNPMLKGDVSGLIVNNLIYNCHDQAIRINDYYSSGASLASILNNVFMVGADTPDKRPMIATINRFDPRSEMYLAGNHYVKPASEPYPYPLYCGDPHVLVYQPVVWVDPLTVLPTEQVKDWVLTHAGARPAERNPIDRRIIDSVRNGTGRIINSQKDVGGYPDYPSTSRQLTLPDNPNGDDDNDGYTNLEEWLHQMAHQVE